MMGKIHVYKCLYIASIKSTAGNKTKLFPSPFLISTSSFLSLAEIVLRSATEKTELGGYVTVSCSSKTTECSSTADWLKL